MRIRDLVLRYPFRDRQEGVKPLGDAPGEAFALCFVLHVAGCHVDADEIAVDCGEGGRGIGGREVAVGTASADDEAELDFMVQGCADGADTGASGGWEDGGGGFEEEEGLRGARGGEFGYVVSIGRKEWSVVVTALGVSSCN